MKNFLKKNRYYLYLLYVPIYLIMFFVTENFINGSSEYWVSYVPFDDVIPFIDWFVIFYVLWYPLMFGVGILLLIKDKSAYERYVLMIIIGFTLSIVFFWILPNGQNLRPESFEDKNIFTEIISFLYSSDTNTNVLPSMHVYGALCAIIAIIDSDRVKNIWVSISVSTLAILISMSTVFIKQHSILDAVAAVVLIVPLYLAIYWKRLFSRKNSLYEKTKAIATSEESIELRDITQE